MTKENQSPLLGEQVPAPQVVEVPKGKGQLRSSKKIKNYKDVKVEPGANIEQNVIVESEVKEEPEVEVDPEVREESEESPGWRQKIKQSHRSFLCLIQSFSTRTLRGP